MTKGNKGATGDMEIEQSELRSRLETLYQDSPVIAGMYPFESTFERLDDYIQSRESQFLNPYEFTIDTGWSKEKAVSLFFLLAVVCSVDKPILRIQYQFTCEKGTKSVLYDKDLEDFHCEKTCTCNTPVNLAEEITHGKRDALIFFELHPSLAEKMEKGA